MKIYNSTFQKLITEIPSVEIPVEWYGGQGASDITSLALNTLNFFIIMDLTVSESGKIDSGDHFTPPSFSSNGVNSEVTSLKVYKNNSDKEIILNPKQEHLICNEIISSIILTS